jgi:hypothetical protein
MTAMVGLTLLASITNSGSNIIFSRLLSPALRQINLMPYPMPYTGGSA